MPPFPVYGFKHQFVSLYSFYSESIFINHSFYYKVDSVFLTQYNEPLMDLLFYSAAAFSVLGLLAFLAYVQFRHVFDQQVSQLFLHSANQLIEVFDHGVLEDLPVPIKRYFDFAMKNGQTLIRSVRVKHTGFFKTSMNQPWVRIRGEQYATAPIPGLIWKGKTNWFEARDMFLYEHGRLTVALLSFVKVIDAKGPKYDEGELLRWLGESVLYPTNFLPGDSMHWSAIDSNNAKLTYTHKHFTLNFEISFNANGSISQMKTLRYMDLKRREIWLIKPSMYESKNGVWIPTYLEVSWRLPEGDFCYAKFSVDTLEYNKPFRFTSN